MAEILKSKRLVLLSLNHPPHHHPRNRRGSVVKLRMGLLQQHPTSGEGLRLESRPNLTGRRPSGADPLLKKHHSVLSVPRYGRLRPERDLADPRLQHADHPRAPLPSSPPPPPALSRPFLRTTMTKLSTGAHLPWQRSPPLPHRDQNLGVIPHPAPRTAHHPLQQPGQSILGRLFIKHANVPTSIGWQTLGVVRNPFPGVFSNRSLGLQAVTEDSSGQRNTATARAATMISL